MAVEWLSNRSGIVVVSRVVFAGGRGGNIVLVTEFWGTALNGLFCADVLWPLDLAPPPHRLYLQNRPGGNHRMNRWRSTTFSDLYLYWFDDVTRASSRCTVSSVQKRHVAIARLRNPANLGRTSQEVWFIILVVTSTKEVLSSANTIVRII